MTARDKEAFAERVHFPFTVTANGTAPRACFISSDDDTVNDYYDRNTGNDGTSETLSGSAGRPDSCTGACIAFQVNRAIWGVD